MRIWFLVPICAVLALVCKCYLAEEGEYNDPQGYIYVYRYGNPQLIGFYSDQLVVEDTEMYIRIGRHLYRVVEDSQEIAKAERKKCAENY